MAKTILIVGNNKKLGRLIQDWLEMVFPDYDITIVLSGMDAIDFSAKEKPEIVIMDINMAGTNSMEAARQLKNEYPLTKVIFLSLFNDDVHRGAALAAGASGYVAKSKINVDFIPLLRKLISSEVRESSPALHR